MSKRYVIQVFVTNENNATLNAWETVQHPKGGDWKTRSRTTAIVDAAKLRNAGETRELRVMESKPVYELVDAGVDAAAIAEVANVFAETPMLMIDEDEDEDEDEDVDDDAEFELVDESNDSDGNAHNN